MSKVSPIINSLNSGEWSPKMWGRTDLAQYASACKKMRNFVMLVHGGATRTPGTEYIAETKDSARFRDKKARLIPFQFSTTQAYVMEVGEEYARFYKDRGQIVDGSDVPIEIALPYGEDDIADLRYVQDKDLMYLFHRGYRPKELTRSSHTLWTLTDVEFEDGPYLPAQNIAEGTTNLVTNGDMEDDSNWTATGSPALCEQVSDKSFEQSHSWYFIDDAADAGVQSDDFTTETGKTYRLRFRIYTAATTFKLKVHQGDDSGTFSIEETITSVPVDEWTEYERYFEEAAGGTGAYIQILTALTASATGYAGQYPPAYSPAYVKATSEFNGTLAPHLATDPSLLLTGTQVDRQWDTTWGTKTNQRFHIDLGEEKLISRIYYQNGHISGSYTDRGAKTFTLWGSNNPTSFNTLTYATDTGWTQIDTLSVTTFDQHAASNASDPKYITVNAEAKYRYYAFKIADNWGGSLMSIRHIELQITEYEDDPGIWIDDVEMNKIEALTMTPSATTGEGITLTAGDDFFVAGHIGAFIRLTHGEDTGYVKIVSITSATVAVADVISDLGDTAATTDWREGAWSTKNGFPACGAFYEQRLVAASTDNDPDGIWGSKPTEYTDFAPGTLATDAVEYKLQSDIIRWICPMGQLVVGTVKNEYRLGSYDTGALDARDVKMTQQSRKGTANIEPIGMGNAILFVQKYGDSNNYGRKVRELNYDMASDSYLGNDLTIFAEHITGTGIVDWAYMDAPFPILWCATADGDLIGMTYDKEQKVIGWHKHPTNGEVESVCVIPGANQDELWMIVKRTIDGTDKRFVEVMADFAFGELEDAFFVDCGLTYDGWNDDPDDYMTLTPDGEVTALAIVDGGENYTNGTLVGDEAHGAGFAGTFTVTAGVITGVVITDDGGGYLLAPTIIALCGAGTGAEITATITRSGKFFLKATGHTPFTEAMEGSTYRLVVGDDTIDLLIDTYVSTSVVEVTAVDDIPEAMFGVASSEWALLTDSVSGLDHLEGEDVDVLADGEVVTGKTVASGAISLTTEAAKVHVGLPKERTYIEPVEFDDGSYEQGTGQGKQKRIHSIAMRLHETVGGKIGTTESNLESIKYPPGTTGLYTGLTGDTQALGGWQKDVSCIIEQPKPLPMTVIAIMPRYRTEDK